MTQLVQVQGLGTVAFPDGMTPEEMAAAIKRNLNQEDRATRSAQVDQPLIARQEVHPPASVAAAVPQAPAPGEASVKKPPQLARERPGGIDWSKGRSSASEAPDKTSLFQLGRLAAGTEKAMIDAPLNVMKEAGQEATTGNFSIPNMLNAASLGVTFGRMGGAATGEVPVIPKKGEFTLGSGGGAGRVPPKGPQLVVARRMPDGFIRYGKPGKLHADLLTPGEPTPSDSEMGFATEVGGKFMSREEALAFVKKNEPERAPPKTTPTDAATMLEAGQYAAGKPAKPTPALDRQLAKGVEDALFPRRLPYATGASKADVRLMGKLRRNELPPEPPGLPGSPAASARLPERPTTEFVRGQEDLLHKLRTGSAADVIEMRRWLDALPKDVKEANKLAYHNWEDPTVPLTPQAEKLKNTFVVPLKNFESGLYADAVHLNVFSPEELSTLDPYMHRIPVSDVSKFEIPGSATLDPLALRGRSLSTKAASMHARKPLAMVDDAGTRHVVTQYPGGDAVQIWKNGRPSKPEPGGFITTKPARTVEEHYLGGRTTIERPVVAKVEKGKLVPPTTKPSRIIPDTLYPEKTTEAAHAPGKFTPGHEFVDKHGHHWQLRTATTREIEAAGVKSSTTGEPIKYRHDAIGNTVTNILELQKAIRNARMLEQLKASPEWAKYAKPLGEAAPPHYVETKLPQLRGWKIDPKLAHAFDDFYQRARFLNIPPGNMLEQVNRFAIASIFFNPLIHIANVGTMWATARGWDWIKPFEFNARHPGSNRRGITVLPGWRSLALDGARAFRAVTTRNQDYVDFLRNGGSLIHSGIVNADFTKFMLKRLGSEIEAHPEKWTDIAKTLGMAPLELARAAFYTQTHHVLWASNDMLMMQRIFELERKGMSRAAAIKETELYIPSYRTPSEIAGSRALSQFTQDTTAAAFGPYHYALFKHWATIIGRLLKPQSTLAQRWTAVGNLMAIAFITGIVYPLALDPIARKITGSAKAKFRKFGELSMADKMWELFTGTDKSFKAKLMEAVDAGLTLAPATKELIQQAPWVNTDFFTGQPVGTGGVSQQIYERGKHAVGTLVAPAGLAIRADKSGLSRVLQSQIGISNPTAKAVGAQRYYKGQEDKSARKRLMKDPEFVRWIERKLRAFRSTIDGRESADTLSKRLEEERAKRGIPTPGLPRYRSTEGG